MFLLSKRLLIFAERLLRVVALLGLILGERLRFRVVELLLVSSQLQLLVVAGL